jgi:hypothetical protein
MVKAIEVVNPFEPMAIPLAGTKLNYCYGVRSTL